MRRSTGVNASMKRWVYGGAKQNTALVLGGSQSVSNKFVDICTQKQQGCIRNYARFSDGFLGAFQRLFESQRNIGHPQFTDFTSCQKGLGKPLDNPLDAAARKALESR